MANVIVFVGSPGSGRNTQANILAERLGYFKISIGDLFLFHTAWGTEIGKRARSFFESGKLVPDEITIEMMRTSLRQQDYEGKQDVGIIVVGFPRNEEQATALDAILDDFGDTLVSVLHSEISDKAALERLTGRMVCDNCQTTYHKRYKPPKKSGQCDKCGGSLVQRSDDTEEVVKKRLSEYKEKTVPLLPRYKEKGLLIETNGERPIEKVTEDLLAALARREGQRLSSV
jgi:adenylate kinase